MKKIFLFSLFFFSFLYSYNFVSKLKTGDIVFALYNGYFDYGLSKYLGTKYSHTLIMTKEGLFSFSIMNIVDRGIIFKDSGDTGDKIRIVVYRPVMSKEQEKIYQKCVNEYSHILNKKVNKGEIVFDWEMKNYPNSYVCATFIFHILKECLPDYKKYFIINNVDRVHYKNGKPVIYFANALNKKMFKIIKIK